MSDHWTSHELRTLRRLTTPEGTQLFLDELPYRCEDGHFSARAALRDGRAHCFDGALLAAAALRRSGLAPHLILLCADRDDNHLICAYRRGKLWGAVAKSNFPGLRLREPLFRTPRELVLSYFEFYFNMEREKTLRGFFRPLAMPDPARLDWECDDTTGDILVDRIYARAYEPLLTANEIRRLGRVDQRLYRSQLLGVDTRGVYRKKGAARS
jgi:hypothetical protein